MVMIRDNKGIERYSLTEPEYKFIMRGKEKITHEDQEFWVAFGGDTGVGKSLKSMLHMFPIFPGLTVKEICFDREEFVNCVLEAKKGTGIICDESISVFFSRSSMTKEGRLVSELAAQIRQKNLAIFLNIPEVISLDWTIQKKLNAYIHCWESRKKIGGKLKTIKGNCAIYPEIPGAPYRTRILDYIRKKRSNPLHTQHRPDYWITTPGNPIGEGFKRPWYPVDEAAYRKKKEAILDKYAPGHVETSKQTIMRDKAIYLLKEHTGKSFRELQDMLDMPRTTIQDAIRRYKGDV